MSESTDKPVVLAIDDEPDMLDIITLWLEDSYEVLTATSGDAGLDVLNDTVDVVLLDRHMPGGSGDEVLSSIRDLPEEYQVGFVTATDPDFDIIDLDFDTFVMKPLDGASVKATVERLLARPNYEEAVQEWYTVAETLALLEQTKTEAELNMSTRYQELSERVAALEDTVPTEIDELSRENL